MSYMKADFDRILRDYGHKVWLQRKSVDEKGKTVYKFDKDPHLCRYNLTDNLNKVQEEEVVGVANTTDRTYYFKADVHPFEGDRIYEYDLRTKDNQTVWQIEAATMMRGVGGQVEFYEVGTTRIRPN